MGEAHLAEWQRFREMILEPLFAEVAGGDVKNAKVLADIIKICQEGERRAESAGACGAADNEITVSFEE